VGRLFAPFVVLTELAEIVAQGWHTMDTLREVITAGEPLHATRALRDWFRKLPDAHLVNQYGPTETHVVTAHPLGTDPARWPQAPPIGQPISGIQVQVLDDALQPVPPGATGELYVRGAALARGYVNRPGFTAERFIPDPHSSKPGARMYRTGDRVRVGFGGALEFVGRSDAQIKVRGTRVEPGEIERTAASHPAVSACAVRYERAAHSEPVLIAYVAAVGVDSAALRNFLTERLAPAMVPERIVIQPSLPLNAHGKVDVDALRVAAVAGRRAGRQEQAESPMQAGVLEIWRDVLGAGDVGLDDDFFECGGHSLKAARAVAAMRRVFGQEVPLRWLFECRTPRRMALRLAGHVAASDADASPAVAPTSSAAPRAGADRTGDAIAAVWCDTLGRGQVRPGDDFFALGGHSLAAVRLVSRLASRLGVEVPVRMVFEHPRFESFSREVATLAEATGAKLGAPEQPVSRPAIDDGLTLEDAPLLPLLVTGRLPRVDAAALGYFADDSVRHCRRGRDAFLRAWCDGVPMVASVTDTGLGRTAVIRLPWLASELYDDRDALVDSVVDAVRLAAAAGARVVSLTGLIPSATDNGRALAAALPRSAGLPVVTTGHATTAATVVMSVRRALAEGGRALGDEHVGFLGLGSIGATTLQLMLERLPHPARLTLCDVYARRTAIAALAERLRLECGYRGGIEVLASEGEVPDPFYSAGLIVGATNVPDVLDVSRLRPGTLMVDDSGPHCFNTRIAIHRLESRGDILFTEGGVLRTPHSMQQTRHLPAALDSIMSADYLASLRRYDSDNITGCVLAALLGARFQELGPVVGEVAPGAATAHFDRLLELDFNAAPLRCGTYVLDPGAIGRFRERFGGADLRRGDLSEARGE